MDGSDPWRRRWYDVATAKYDGRQGIYGGAWSGPVFVLTHEPPAAPDDKEIVFLSAGLDDAVATARAAAGEKNLGIFGAKLARQTLLAGLLDEIIIHLVPVVLGDGIRFYDSPDTAHIALEPVDVSRAGRTTDLRLRPVFLMLLLQVGRGWRLTMMHPMSWAASHGRTLRMERTRDG